MQTIQTTTLTVSDSTDMCNDLLTANPDIKGIYCMYEQAGIAAVDCLETAGLTGEISIVSSDGSPASIAYIRSGAIDGASSFRRPSARVIMPPSRHSRP